MQQLYYNIRCFLRFITLLYLLLLTINIQANNLKPNNQFEITHGLSDNGVTNVFKDSKGYIWIGTYNGLNRYNGYEFEVYKNTPEQKLLPGNRIRSFAEDENGNIWIGTESGIVLYRYSLNTFTSFSTLPDHLKDLNYRDIQIDFIHGKIYCATLSNGIVVFNRDNTYSHHISIKSQQFEISSAVRFNDSNLLYSTSQGLYWFNTKNESFSSINESVNFKCYGTQVLNDSILITGSVNGLFVLKGNKEDGYQQFRVLLPEKTITTFYVDENMALWVGTLHNGLFYFNNYNDEDSYMQKDDISRISKVIPTKDKGIWLSSFDKGVFKFPSQQKVFKHISISHAKSQGVDVSNVIKITPYKNSTVMVAGINGCFNELDINRLQFKHSIPEKYRKEKGATSNDVFIDSGGRIWIQRGASELVILSQDYKNIASLNSKNYPLINHIHAIAEDKMGNIWLGVEDDILRISLKGNHIDSLLSVKEMGLFKETSLSHINNIYADPLYNIIWATTYYDGLFRIKLNEHSYKPEIVHQYKNDFNDTQSISNNFVTSIVRLQNNQLWIGTEGGGICKVKESKEGLSFKAVSEHDGLSNNNVRSLLAHKNKLWVATANGLNELDTENNVIRKFGLEDGLPFLNFRIGAAKLSDSLMLLSGYDGLLYFDPNQVKVNRDIPLLELGKFTLFNTVIHPKDTINGRVVLDKRLNDIPEITLKHNENVFSIETVPLHYSNPHNFYIRYQLSPVSKTWIVESGLQRNLSFNGLPSGEYRLRIQTGNQLKEWSEEKEIRIIILPPWWKTVVAKIAMVFLLVMFVWVVLHFRFKYMKLNHHLQIEQLEKNQQQEINDAKLRFFSNISHEIKTPLTLISGPVSMLLDRFKAQEDVKEKLDIVQRQSKKISQLVDQVHDFQRSEANQLSLNKTVFKFNYFINELIQDFEFMALTDKKELSVNGVEDVFVLADKDKLEKIFNNLLNNAFKYTEKGDSITIDFSVKNDVLSLHVRDSGIGIKEEDLPYIFERFYMSKKDQEKYKGGSGIGLAFSQKLVEMHYGSISVESEEEKGSCFTLDLPIITTISSDNQQRLEEDILEAEKSILSYKFLSGNTDTEGVKVNEEWRQCSVFIAEDNSELRNFISDTLSKYFKIKAFKDGSELLNRLNDEWPDLIISDVLMPEVNGFELCRTVKSDIKTSHIPIILLTACSSIDDRIKGMEYGADLFLKKPFNIQYLISGIEAQLNIRKNLRERFSLDIPLKQENGNEEKENNLFLTRLYKLMEENIAVTNIELDEFAEKLYLNRTFFYQKVKALTNQTPFELLKSYRIKRAADLLLNENLSVLEAFERTGFKSRPHFNREFKNTYGKSPSEYVKAHMMKKS